MKTQFSPPRELLVVDLEATCDDRGTIPRDETEIIEVGAVLVDARSLEPIDELGTFVRPVLHPRITAFCTRLTTITQGDVDNALRFDAAVADIAEWLGDRRPLFCSWGDYDWNQLAREARRSGVALPFGDEHLNVKRLFSEKTGERRRLGLAEALARVGLRREGTLHRGLDDARNIARLLPSIFPRAKEEGLRTPLATNET
jgi:inhibitor of KinA sporulation pathway (predicted exonuclease)